MWFDEEWFTRRQQLAAGKLTGKYRRAWVEEGIDLEVNPGERLSGPAHTQLYLGNCISRNRLRWLIILLLAIGTLVGGRISYLQLIRGSYYRMIAENNRVRLRPILAERGIIYDSFGRELVQNVPSFYLALAPRDLPIDPANRERSINAAAILSGQSVDEIKSLIKKFAAGAFESVIIKENIDYNLALEFYINSDYPGLFVESGTKRRYLYVDNRQNPWVASLSHLLGYIGKINDDELSELKDRGYRPTDVVGKMGLEKNYEYNLRGVPGRKKIEVDALGKEQLVLAEEPPTPGKNLTLTIDLDAQAELDRLVTDFIKRTGKKRVAVIALNPNTGGILALVSAPMFNNNDFSGGVSKAVYQSYLNDPDHPLFNRVIGGNYPSGSTVKPVIAAAALQENIISATQTILSTGGIQVGNWFFRDWLVGGHGPTNVTKAIAWSVNSFFYYVGGGYGKFEGLGPERIVRYLYAFGLGRKSGIDISGEQSGFVSSPDWKYTTKGERWFVGDTYNLSIGQGDLLVTPLQVAVWTAAFANGGKIITPHLVSSLTDPVTKQVTTLSFPDRTNGLVNDKNLLIIKNAMGECVRTGSCGGLRRLNFSSGGKTGTAQWGSTKNTQAWFTSFAPFENPQIVVTILVEEGGEGGIISMPIARDFLRWWGKKYLGR